MKKKSKESSESIMYLEGDINYTYFVFDNGNRKAVAKTLKRFAESNKFQDWLRIHRAYLVNPKFVKQVSRISCTLELSSGYKLPISRRKLVSYKETGKF